LSKAVLNAVLQGIGDVQVIGVSLLEQLRVYSNDRLKKQRHSTGEKRRLD
jgi:hypothetical protein